MNCGGVTRKGHEPSSLPRLSRSRQTRRAARSLCDGRGSKSRGGHHRNHTRRQLRDHRARFVSSLFALVELEQKAPSIARRGAPIGIPLRNGPVQSIIFIIFKTSSKRASTMDLELPHKISSIAELVGTSATASSIFSFPHLFQDMMIAPGMSHGTQPNRF
jgi:hypothetical protein